MKRMLAFLLALCMVLSMAACGAPTQEPQQENTTNSDQLDRQDKELVAELIGGTDASGMTDAELDALVDQLVGEESTSGVVNLVDKKPAAEVTMDEDAYDSDGAMTEPFDQVYPELMEQVKFSGESILIKLESNKLTDGLKAAGIGALQEIVPMEKASWYEAKLTEGTDPKTAIAAVRTLDEVLLAEYNYEVEVAALDDYKHFDKEQDEDFKKNGHNKDQWHFHHCGIPDGYQEMENAGGKSSVVVAVIDSGVDYTHEDLKDNMWVNDGEIPDNNIDDDGNGYIDDYYGVDIITGKGSGDDTNGHGTHVAGIVAARNNNTGVLGVAYNVQVMSVKAANHSGILHQGDIAKAVLYAYENGAEVINMSFGGTTCSIAVQDALATAYTRCVLVASAGNNGAPNQGIGAIPNYPAALTYVLGVMSVDQNGRESAFTNWDVIAFNGVEYEVYAPGENIMSTLPGNRYGYLSGTSMAAPVVSAFAAILRSEFVDRDKYPTKFIYGQLASTSEYYAECLDPELHGGHNLPQIVNLEAALTKMPKPEVGYQDYRLFDDPKYSDKNNGDGVIDAGETIALGLTLRNRWGMSENTLVTIDTKSSISGLEDPYITIHNDTVNYGSVGTYSTGDCGKTWTDELWTGWEEPFLITISEDCPNDYEFTLNISITCENALDPEDATTYRSSARILEAVRAGYLVPAVIDKDMVWTKDNLYIISNGTMIKEGVTVRVEPGTHIQFWTDDPNDTYAASYIPYLLVNGNFLVEGTKEEQVYIYPSQLMDKFGVEIGASSTGYVSLKYADVTNLFYRKGQDKTGTKNRINLADHCTFRRNYSGKIWYRYVSNGNVYETFDIGEYCFVGSITAKDCVFYKIGGIALMDGGYTLDRCIFVECGLRFNEVSTNFNYIPTFHNCVFLGNSLVDQTNPDYHYNSSMTVGTLNRPISFNPQVYYCAETGTTYISLYRNEELCRRFLKDALGVENASYAIIETPEELQWLRENTELYGQKVGIYYDTASGRFLWSDGSEIGEFMDPAESVKDLAPRETVGVYITNSSYYTGSYITSVSSGKSLFEIPGEILPEEIFFESYTAELDLERTLQVLPQSLPVQLPLDSFRYESSDETVLTVSDTGVVTPVAIGTADVLVWSKDKAVKNYITVTVREYVPLEEISLAQSAMELPVGATYQTEVRLAPLDTTRKSVTYASSDPAVATVDQWGRVTGISAGKTTITATCEGMNAQMEITTYVQAASLELGSIALSLSLADGATDLPAVIANEGAQMLLSWRSTDEAVATIENGKLVPQKAGTTTVIVADSRSGLSASCLVMVGEAAAMAPIKAMKIETMHDYGKWVLLEDGRLYHWCGRNISKPICVATDVAFVDTFGENVAIMRKNGLIQYGYCRSSDMCFYSSGDSSFQGRAESVANFAFTYDSSTGGGRSYFVVTKEGTAYAWGSNNNGQLGLNTTATVSQPTLVNLDGVVEVRSRHGATWFLTDTGDLYTAGKTGLALKLVKTNVARIMENDNQNCYYLTKEGAVEAYKSGEYETLVSADLSGMDQVWYSYGDTIAMEDGMVYTVTNDVLSKVEGITDAAYIHTGNGAYYIQTEGGSLLGFGSNSSAYNNLAGAASETNVTAPVVIPLEPMAEEVLNVLDSNLEEGVLTEDTLRLSFNKRLTKAYAQLYGDGNQVTMNCAISDYNHIIVDRNRGFVEGVQYELVFDVGALTAAGGFVNTEEIRIPFTYVPAQEEPSEDLPEEDATEEVIHESVLDETVERYLTYQTLQEMTEAWQSETQLNDAFYGNAILNPISTDDVVSHWLRPIAYRSSASSYGEKAFGGNWWGTTNTRAIELQMTDYTDFNVYERLMYAPFLTEAPENTFPFVTSVKLFDKYGDEVKTVGNEEVKFQVKFNRDMDTSIPLQVRFGSCYPYGDYEIAGKYVDARTWEGVYTLNTIIENGNQLFTIENGCSATEDLGLQLDRGRFGFVIDTTAAQALIMQGTATDTGIELRWTQDDFTTLMGYNIYRSDAEDGLYTRLNKTVIPTDIKEWFDNTVEPGKVYYYNFTVVQTDMAESEPSGKIAIMSKDTMAPDIYHSPVASAFSGKNLVISATITDNLSIAYANLYYRTTGAETWTLVRMNKLNDKYSAIIPGDYVQLEGLEYYIEAFDGVSFTYKGSADAPYTIQVQQAVDANALGDVDGDGVITNLDALKLLYAINDKYNMTAEEFARADLNGDGELWAAEALRILQYVSGAVGSVKM